jgi:hypothetical protein
MPDRCSVRSGRSATRCSDMIYVFASPHLSHQAKTRRFGSITDLPSQA